MPGSSAASAAPTAATGSPSPAEEISLADVIRAVEGPLASVRGEAPGGRRVPRRRRAPAATSGSRCAPACARSSSTSRSPTSRRATLPPEIKRARGRPRGVDQALTPLAGGRSHTIEPASGSSASASARVSCARDLLAVASARPRRGPRSRGARRAGPSPPPSRPPAGRRARRRAGARARRRTFETGPRKPITNSSAGCVVELARRADLGDLAVAQQHDPVGELHRLLLVVRDEHGRDRGPPRAAAAATRAGRARTLASSAPNGSSSSSTLRLDRERAGERHALALAAGELRRVAVVRSRRARRGRSSSSTLRA